MRANTAVEVGAVIRSRRHDRRLSQQDLAVRAGVARSSLSAIERGHARAELGVVLRVLRALDLIVDVAPRAEGAGVDLAAHLAQFDEPPVGRRR